MAPILSKLKPFVVKSGVTWMGQEGGSWLLSMNYFSSFNL